MKCRCMLDNVQVQPNTDSFDVFSLLIKERILFLSQEIDGEIATSIAAKLFLLDRQSQDEEITLYINSSGGTIENGLLTIYDTLQFIRAPVKTVCIGEAYSSAAVILAAGTRGRRYAYPSARILIHSVQVDDMSGNQKEIEDESRRIKELNQKLMMIIARHTGQDLNKVRRDCKKDKYFSPDQAIKYGLIDHVIQPFKEIPDIIIGKKMGSPNNEA